MVVTITTRTHRIAHIATFLSGCLLVLFSIDMTSDITLNGLMAIVGVGMMIYGAFRVITWTNHNNFLNERVR